MGDVRIRDALAKLGLDWTKTYDLKIDFPAPARGPATMTVSMYIEDQGAVAELIEVLSESKGQLDVNVKALKDG